MLWLLTKELGLLKAVAKSVREETSKLRYFLQDFSLARVSLVRGRGVWRITGAERSGGHTLTRPGDIAVYGRISALLSRMAPSEDEKDALFNVCDSCRTYLCETDTSHEKELTEILTVARILHVLGYMPDSLIYKTALGSSRIDEEVLDMVKEHRKIFLKDINNGIMKSQL
jgi:recombinational DNA repair protein (RecF pathway)